MKIAKVESLHADAGSRIFDFLKVTTDTGLVGWSEYNEAFGGPGLAAVIDRLAPTVIGKDPRAWEAHVTTMYALRRQSSGGVVQQAIAAIENALLDIKARALGIPVYELLGGEYVFSGAITRPDIIQKRPHLVQKVVTALVKASHFIQTKSPEEIAAAIPADLVGDRAQYIESLRASREIYAPHGQVSQSGVDVLMKSLDSFGVFKPGQKVDVASTYDMTFVRQAMKDLKLQ